MRMFARGFTGDTHLNIDNEVNDENRDDLSFIEPKGTKVGKIRSNFLSVDCDIV